MSLTPSQLSAYSRLFSSTVIRQMANKRKSPLFARLVKEAGELAQDKSLERVGDVFESAFKVLKKGHNRDEYIYKSALTHRVLLGKHNLTTASMLTEFRTGECKADISILNGTMTVYEIKSERDTLTRLERQIRNYKRVFGSVVVIVGENHVNTVMKAIPSDVGVMKLSKRFQISLAREPVDQPNRICPITALESLRVAEAKNIVSRLGREIPTVPNTEMHAALRRIFEKLQPEEVHSAMLETLKKSRSLLPLATLVDQLPKSLQPAALSVPLRKADHAKLVAAVQTPLQQALRWT